MRPETHVGLQCQLLLYEMCLKISVNLSNTEIHEDANKRNSANVHCHRAKNVGTK